MSCFGKPKEPYFPRALTFNRHSNVSCDGYCEDGYYEGVIFSLSTDSLQRVCLPHKEVECASGDLFVSARDLQSSLHLRAASCDGEKLHHMRSSITDRSSITCETINLWLPLREAPSHAAVLGSCRGPRLLNCFLVPGLPSSLLSHSHNQHMFDKRACSDRWQMSRWEVCAVR